MKRLLLAEDEREMRELVELHLRDAGHHVVAVGDGKEALRLALDDRWDLIVLDIMLPGVDGLEICRRLRASEEHSWTPILMLTARSSEIDRVLGLETGADDYLTKPFSVRELVARVKAILRRAEALERGGHDESELELGDLHIDVPRRRVTLAGEPVGLTAKEFDLLLHFARHPGRVFTRSELLDTVWGYGHDGYEHTVNSHINRLRSKIETDSSSPRFVLTVWGVGYRFAEPAELEATAESGP
jgi:DNA-binding response OmpR family regulator